MNSSPRKEDEQNTEEGEGESKVSRSETGAVGVSSNEHEADKSSKPTAMTRITQMKKKPSMIQ